MSASNWRGRTNAFLFQQPWADYSTPPKIREWLDRMHTFHETVRKNMSIPRDLNMGFPLSFEMMQQRDAKATAMAGDYAPRTDAPKTERFDAHDLWISLKRFRELNHRSLTLELRWLAKAMEEPMRLAHQLAVNGAPTPTMQQSIDLFRLAEIEEEKMVLAQQTLKLEKEAERIKQYVSKRD